MAVDINEEVLMKIILDYERMTDAMISRSFEDKGKNVTHENKLEIVDALRKFYFWVCVHGRISDGELNDQIDLMTEQIISILKEV